MVGEELDGDEAGVGLGRAVEVAEKRGDGFVDAALC